MKKPTQKGMEYLRMRGILSSNAKWNRAIEEGINITLQEQIKEIREWLKENYEEDDLEEFDKKFKGVK